MLARGELICFLWPVFRVFEARFPLSDIAGLTRARTVTHPVRPPAHLGKPLGHILNLRVARGTWFSAVARQERLIGLSWSRSEKREPSTTLGSVHTRACSAVASGISPSLTNGCDNLSRSIHCTARSASTEYGACGACGARGKCPVRAVRAVY
eukprot:scaffold35254_cov63-Phaeocystis_antarctica.AAC.5